MERLDSLNSEYLRGKLRRRDPEPDRVVGSVIEIVVGPEISFPPDGASQTDVGIQRTFRLTEKAGLRFRGEFFNLFNHPNFANPTNMLTTPPFGRSTQTLANGLGTGGANGGFNPLYQIGGPRSVQLALKLVF